MIYIFLSPHSLYFVEPLLGSMGVWQWTQTKIAAILLLASCGDEMNMKKSSL